MKIIGISEGGNYIAEVSHSEIEKVFDKYYNKVDRLKPGKEIDLGAGYDFRQQITATCVAMVNASETFDLKQKALLNFATMVAKLLPASGSDEKPEVQ